MHEIFDFFRCRRYLINVYFHVVVRVREQGGQLGVCSFNAAYWPINDENKKVEQLHQGITSVVPLFTRR